VSTPHISVIVPAYNAERFLGRTIESVLTQTVADWEMVVVDDGSTDSTAEIVASYADQDIRVRCVHQANAGLPAARNRGLAESDPKSDYVAFLDADDEWTTDALDVLLHGLECSPSMIGAYGLARFVDCHSRPIREGECEAKCRNRLTLVGDRLVCLDDDLPTTFATLALANRIVVGTALVRRSAFSQVGGFDVTLGAHEDWDLWLRLLRIGDFRFVNKVVMGYRRHDANMSKDDALMLRTGRAVHHKTYTSPENTPEQRSILLRSYRLSKWADARLELGSVGESLKSLRLLDAALHARDALAAAVRWAWSHP
jgi:glycosyltransferase involved in cell wall biosynthesis